MAYYTWSPPFRNHFKISVHIRHTSRIYNGNNNGVGIVIKDHTGRLIRGLSGTIRGLSTMVTQLWALHIGLNQARLANYEIVTLETENFNHFFEVTRNDNRGDTACFWIVEQIKKLLDCYPEWENRIKFIVEPSNRAAHYLAAVGLKNWDSMHYFLEPFGRL